jgi:peptidoglycan hydrolase-like protein with peptidoglycan-binding domain
MALKSASFKNSARLQSAANNKPPLRQGESGPGVALLQFALAALGYSMPKTMSRIVPDGIYGPETVAAVAAFQRDQRLSADGVAGHDTLGRLDDIFADRDPLCQPPCPKPSAPPSTRGTQRGQKKPPTRSGPFAGPGPGLQPGFPVVSNPVVTKGKATIVSGPSPDWVQIGISTRYSVGVNGPDNDLGFNDVTPGTASAPWWEKDDYWVAQYLSDSSLESIWRFSFKHIHGTGPTGSMMIDRFMAGSGGGLLHPNGSDLSDTARNTLTFVNAQVAVRAEIKRQLKAQLDAGSVDWRKLSITVDIPFSTGTHDLTVPLRFRAMIGGIHGTKLYARNFTVRGDQPLDTVWSATFDLKYQMGDHFGVGRDDLYTPDLVAMNVLQHERPGHKPFLNFIEVEDLGLTVVIE